MIVDYKSVVRLRELYGIVSAMLSDCAVGCVNDVRDIVNSKSYEPFADLDVEVSGDGNIVELSFEGKYYFTLVDYTNGDGDLVNFVLNEVCFYKDGENEYGTPNYVAVCID